MKHPCFAALEGSCGRVKEVFVEQLRTTDHEEHDADAERQCAGELRARSERRLRQSMRYAERDMPKTIVNPAMNEVDTSSSSD